MTSYYQLLLHRIILPSFMMIWCEITELDLGGGAFWHSPFTSGSQNTLLISKLKLLPSSFLCGCKVNILWVSPDRINEKNLRVETNYHLIEPHCTTSEDETRKTKDCSVMATILTDLLYMYYCFFLKLF